MTRREYDHNLQQAYIDGYQKGKADAEATIVPTLADLHDRVYQQGKRDGAREALDNIESRLFGGGKCIH